MFDFITKYFSREEKPAPAVVRPETVVLSPDVVASPIMASDPVSTRPDRAPDFVMTITGETKKSTEEHRVFSTGLSGGFLTKVANSTVMGKWAVRYRHGKTVKKSNALVWAYAPDEASAALFQLMCIEADRHHSVYGYQLHFWGNLSVSDKKPQRGTFEGKPSIHQDGRFTDGHVYWEIVHPRDKDRWVKDHPTKAFDWDAWAPIEDEPETIENPNELLEILELRDAQMARLVDVESKGRITEAGKAAIEEEIAESGIVFQDM